MKEFWIYTALRLALFIGAFCAVFGIWLIFSDSVNLLIVLVIAFILSGVGSYVFLERQRSAFAAKVEGRAGRMSEKFEEMRGKED